jgi:hypothetical protein
MDVGVGRTAREDGMLVELRVRFRARVALLLSTSV